MQTTPTEAGGLPGDELVRILPLDAAGVPGSAIDFRIIAEKSLSLILVADHTGAIQYVNPTFCDVTGFAAAEVIGQRVHDLGQLDPRTLADLWDSLGFGQPWRGEFSSQTKKGKEIWVHTSISPITDESGRVTHFIAVNLDITERKRAERALAESEEMFRTLVDTMPAAVVIFQGSHVSYANRTCFDVLGYSAEDLLRLKYWDAIHPDYRDLARERGSARLRGEDVPNNYELRFLKKDGEARWGIYSGAAITYQGKPAVLGVIHDITERKHAERALAESEERFRKLAETTTAATFIFEGPFIHYANSAAAKITGYSTDELRGMNFWEIAHPDVEAATRERQEAMARGEEVPSRAELRIFTKDGGVRWLDFSTGFVELDGKQLVLGAALDVTDRKLAEAAHFESEERYRILYQNNPTMYFTLAEDLTVLSVNEFGAEQLGYAPEDLVGRTVFDVVHGDDQASVRRQLESLLRRSTTRHGLEFRKVKKDGEVIWVQETVRRTQDRSGSTILLVVCEDVTERHKVEEALQRLREELERKAEKVIVSRVSPYGLTFRELTVLHLVTGGRSDKEIGAVLGIRPQTVSKHVANVLKKMKVSSRTQAGVRALREGLIS